MTPSVDASANTLELVALTKRYSDTVAAVDNINLRIRQTVTAAYSALPAAAKAPRCA